MHVDVLLMAGQGGPEQADEEKVTVVCCIVDWSSFFDELIGF